MNKDETRKPQKGNLPHPDFHETLFTKSWRQRSAWNIDAFYKVLDRVELCTPAWTKDLFHPTRKQELQVLRNAIEKMAYIMNIKDVSTREEMIGVELVLGLNDCTSFYQCKFLPEDFPRARDCLNKARDMVNEACRYAISASEERVNDGFQQAQHLYDYLGYQSGKIEKVRPRHVFEQLKLVQEEMRKLFLSREFRENIRHKISSLWDATKHEAQRLSAEHERKQKEWEERQAERARKNQEWRQRQIDNVNRWLERIENAEEFILRLEAQIAELEVRQAEARTQDFADRVQGWIDEKYAKISEVREQIGDLVSKVDDVSQRLRS